MKLKYIIIYSMIVGFVLPFWLFAMGAFGYCVIKHDSLSCPIYVQVEVSAPNEEERKSP